MQAEADFEHPAIVSRAKARAERIKAAQHTGLAPWQAIALGGFILWMLLFVNEHAGLLELPDTTLAGLELLAGLAIIQGACEAFVQSVERIGARFHWDGFLSGTVGSIVATLPEFVVVIFLVQVDPLAAFITTIITIYNNGIIFSIYSFFLPKDSKGKFLMPPSLSKAGSEVLVAGGGITLIVGIVMLALRAETHKTTLTGVDLYLLGGFLIVIYGYYTHALIKYYAEGDEHDHPAHPPDPDEVGHNPSWTGIIILMAVGALGSYFGGEAIGAFADIALNNLGMPPIPTASALAFFAGVSEYIIVYKAHRRGELGIALSNTFGGMSQVLFLLLPFCLIFIAIFGAVTGNPAYALPINTSTVMLMILLFPLIYVLLQYLEDDHTLSNLDAVAMTAVYGLLLYFLFTAPPTTA
jgi:Ca2+/Na+ antiporter